MFSLSRRLPSHLKLLRSRILRIQLPMLPNSGLSMRLGASRPVAQGDLHGMSITRSSIAGPSLISCMWGRNMALETRTSTISHYSGSAVNQHRSQNNGTLSKLGRLIANFGPDMDGPHNTSLRPCRLAIGQRRGRSEAR